MTLPSSTPVHSPRPCLRNKKTTFHIQRATFNVQCSTSNIQRSVFDVLLASVMLHLQSESTARWLSQVDQHLDEILIDHAHCERKAASTAMNLISAYTENRELCREMSRIVEEELEHFEMVLCLLERRGIQFRRLASGPYGRSLNALIRNGEPDRGVDRLLVASLIEARSCERFQLLSIHVRDADNELADFYAGLFESEARHHTTYVRLAEHFAPRAEVLRRLDQLSAKETEIISAGCEAPRMHS